MNKTTKAFWIVGIMIVGALFLLWLNNYTSECKPTHVYNNATMLCYYASNQCTAEETTDGTYCYYNKQGMLSSTAMKVIIALLYLSLIGYLVFMFSSDKKEIPTGEFDPKDYVNASKAIDIVLKDFAKQNEIYCWEDKLGFHFREGAILIRNEWENFVKANQENFLQFDVEVNEGRKVGIFTFITSLSRGEKWIQGGNYRVRHVAFDDYTENNKRALYQLKDKAEKRAEMLIAQGKVDEAQKILLEDSEGDSGPQQTPEEKDDEVQALRESTDRRRVEQRSRNYNQRYRGRRW